ncbi:MAG: DUF488 domain-containing protein [Chloroflexi bacterium]|jgi:uncharacterized protein (DUF488 family)|nr:DUF488 domain-containing protein [Chloroflexota bacterium]MBW7880102.1 DUF488 domain-containing protein [Anaerolineae bacterium]MDL1917004.1 DUF488 domain-containing protein [Anaerolineae bacterium CFX4]OQY82545.1 MAG: hypothetical protein B6D42_09185 [Anaerolineae bacterium UTCFX5]MCC6566640.1 DUF488 domain-containing protein [Chloroflexota bacterium]
MMIEAIYTIGVYHSTEETFFGCLAEARIDTFVDVRDRRGVRGPLYRYANAAYLQEALRKRGITYLHLRELAPPAAIRQIQYHVDESVGGIRHRTKLSQDFVAAYEHDILSKISAAAILEKIGPQARRIVLFCVEDIPTACHRSLVAAKLSAYLKLHAQHLMPAHASDGSGCVQADDAH